MELLYGIGISLLTTLLATILYNLVSKIVSRIKETKPKTRNTETDEYYFDCDSMSSKEIEDKMFGGFGKPYEYR